MPYSNRVIRLPTGSDGSGFRVDRARALGGAIAGVIGGVGMGMLGMILSYVSGQGFWFPMKWIGTTIYGVDGMIGGAGVATVGALIHMIVSAALGAIFAAFVRGTTSGIAALFGGMVYGFAVWGLMTFIGLPVFNPEMRARVDLAPDWWVTSHLVFGGLMFCAPMLIRAIQRAGRPAEKQAEKIETVEEKPMRRAA